MNNQQEAHQKNPAMIPVSIGITAYNEEKNIGALLESLYNQKTSQIKISEIIVIASGCTDATVKIAQTWKEKWPLVRIIEEEKRTGKSAAINHFIKESRTDICVLISADVIPGEYCLEKLCLPFLDKKTGMAGGHIVPTDNPDTFMGYCVHTLWELHHRVALQTPKCGEMVAFRKVLESIPEKSPVDEASIENEIQQKGLRIVYVPDAIVYNKGPENIKEFLEQRRRINAGHYWLEKNNHYKVATANNFRSFKLLTKYFFEPQQKSFLKKIKEFFWTILLIKLVVLGKILALYDFYIKRKSYTIWTPIHTSKNPKNNTITPKP